MGIRHVLIAIISVSAFLCPPAFANGGGKSKFVVINGILDLNPNQNGHKVVHFWTEFDPDLFMLTLVSGKYRILHITIENLSDSQLKLSVDKDNVIAETADGHRQKGVLDIFRKEPAFWDSLSQTLRKDVEYPATVEPQEEESIFVLFETPSLDNVPVKISYWIDSLQKTVTIGDEPPKEPVKAQVRPGSLDEDSSDTRPITSEAAE